MVSIDQGLGRHVHREHPPPRLRQRHSGLDQVHGRQSPPEAVPTSTIAAEPVRSGPRLTVLTASESASDLASPVLFSGPMGVVVLDTLGRLGRQPGLPIRSRQRRRSRRNRSSQAIEIDGVDPDELRPQPLRRQKPLGDPASNRAIADVYATCSLMQGDLGHGGAPRFGLAHGGRAMPAEVQALRLLRAETARLGRPTSWPEPNGLIGTFTCAQARLSLRLQECRSTSRKRGSCPGADSGSDAVSRHA